MYNYFLVVEVGANIVISVSFNRWSFPVQWRSGAEGAGEGNPEPGAGKPCGGRDGRACRMAPRQPSRSPNRRSTAPTHTKLASSTKPQFSE